MNDGFFLSVTVLIIVILFFIVLIFHNHSEYEMDEETSCFSYEIVKDDIGECMLVNSPYCIDKVIYKFCEDTIQDFTDGGVK